MVPGEVEAMRRLVCGACGNGKLDLFVDVGDSPIANRYPAAPNEKQERYPLQLGKCALCGLVQMMEIVPDTELYGKDYGFYSGGSLPQLQYHARGAELLMGRFQKEARRGVVEVACNDGSLLQHFRDFGYPSLGIDPAAGPVDVARQRGLDVYQCTLTTGLAQEIRDQRGPTGLVIAYNSMAHVEDLPETLNAIRLLMDDESVAVFEVQYLPDLIAGNMYDQIYHEHRFFYSLSSLRRAAAIHGLYVVDAELIELQNGGLRVTLSTARDARPQLSVHEIARTEVWLDTFTGFQGLVDRTRDHLWKLLWDVRGRGGRIGGYGAAAKATTITNFCNIDRDVVGFVVDTTIYKQGKFIPGTNIPIVAPEDAPEVDTMLLFAANYLGTVLRDNPHRGNWMVPQPVPMIL